MVGSKHKSGRLKKVSTRIPGGKLVMHYKREKPGKPQCNMCGEYLKGVARGIISKVNKFSKTEKRPERPYGGVLCSKCMRKGMVEKARAMVV